MSLWQRNCISTTESANTKTNISEEERSSVVSLTTGRVVDMDSHGSTDLDITWRKSCEPFRKQWTTCRYIICEHETFTIFIIFPGSICPFIIFWSPSHSILIESYSLQQELRRSGCYRPPALPPKTHNSCAIILSVALVKWAHEMRSAYLS